jgi:alkaline phosphatase D
MNSTYKKEHQELLQFIKDNGISGVVLLSGDRHFTELTRRDNKEFYPFYDFTCSAISSIPNNEKEPNQQRVEGT